MRTLLITLGFPPAVGGIQRFLHRRCLLLPDDIAVLAPRVAGWRAFDAQQPFSIRRWPGWGSRIPGLRRLLQTFWPLLLAFRWQREQRFARIECGQALPCGLVALFLARLWRVPYDVWAYGDDLCKPARWPLARALLRFVLRHARCVWAISRATRAVVLSLGVEPARARVLYPWPGAGVSPQSDPSPPADPFLSSRGGEETEAPILLAVARLEARKGVQEAIRALALVRREVPAARLVVVGEGPYRRELERLSEALGLRDSVHFAGRISDEELAAAYRTASLLVFTPTPRAEQGEREGFGIVCLEANACGCPVVAWASADGGTEGVAEAVLHGETGLVVSQGDLSGLAAAVVRLLSDPVEAARLGDGGRRRAENLVREARALLLGGGMTLPTKGNPTPAPMPLGEER
jgi:phosphatidylinositol alpha-1,6-mannosyltransferase